MKGVILDERRREGREKGERKGQEEGAGAKASVPINDKRACEGQQSAQVKKGWGGVI